MNHYDRGLVDRPLSTEPGAASAFQALAPETGPGIRDIAEAVGRRRWPLAAWLMICLALAVFFGARTPPEYTATAEVLLEARGAPPSGLGAGGSAAPALDNAQAESQTHVIGSERVLRYVFEALDLADLPDYAAPQPGLTQKAVSALRRLIGGGPAREDPQARAHVAKESAFALFTSLVSVKRIGQSYVLGITFKANAPESAARIANAIATAYLRDQVNVRAADSQRGIDYLQGRVALIRAELEAADVAIRDGTVPAMALADADARIISAALAPLGPSAPRKGLILALGGAFGLMSGIGMILLLHALDRTLHTPAQIWATLQVDCLGTVSLRRRPALDLVSAEPGSDFAASVRAVRATLLSKLPTSRPVTVGLLSCGDRAGVTTLAANLARVLAAAGRPVALLDADLRKPTLSRMLAAGGYDRLDRLLSGSEAPATVRLCRVASGVDLLPASDGRATADPNQFLGSPAMAGILATLRQEHTVIVDLPALERSLDGQAVGPLLDGVVLVAAAGRTPSDELAAAIRSLTGTGTTVLGLILSEKAAARR